MGNEVAQDELSDAPVGVVSSLSPPSGMKLSAPASCFDISDPDDHVADGEMVAVVDVAASPYADLVAALTVGIHATGFKPKASDAGSDFVLIQDTDPSPGAMVKLTFNGLDHNPCGEVELGGEVCNLSNLTHIHTQVLAADIALPAEKAVRPARLKPFDPLW